MKEQITNNKMEITENQTILLSDGREIIIFEPQKEGETTVIRVLTHYPDGSTQQEIEDIEI